MVQKLHCVNGSDKFQIVCTKGDLQPIVMDFGLHYQALHEYDKGVGVSAKSITGKKAKKVLFIDYRWEIDLSGAMDLPEGKLLNQLKNLELDGWLIWLTPHISVPARTHLVQIIEEERKLSTYPGINPYNKDYVIWFENVNPILRYDWQDPTPPETLITDEPIEAVT